MGSYILKPVMPVLLVWQEFACEYFLDTHMMLFISIGLWEAFSLF